MNNTQPTTVNEEIEKMHETASGRISERTGWSSLATITTFDRGKATPHKWKTENALVSSKRTAINPPSLFVESLVEQLCKLYEKDPAQQNKLYTWICQKLHDMKLIDKTYKIEEFQFMRNSYQRALFKLLTVSNSTTLESKLETYLNQSPSRLALPYSDSSYIYDCSRYQNDFHEVKFIARGGFGRVFHVRNKVDSCEYAIKKICLRCRDEEQLVNSLREVRTLANLDHCNVVAYKAAWFEPLSGMSPEEDYSGSSSPKISQEADRSDDDILESSISERVSKVEAEEDSGNIVFEHGNEDVPSTKWSLKTATQEIDYHISRNDIKTCPQIEAHIERERETLNYSVSNNSLCDHHTGSDVKGCRGLKVSRIQPRMEYAVLHIQMQLCKESLRDWLDLRNDTLHAEFKEDNFTTKNQHTHYISPQLDGFLMSTAVYIFREILNGVEYMHSKGIVHHDLKPSNIFVDGLSHKPSNSGAEGENASGGARRRIPNMEGRRDGYQVRVGDFGLACHLAHPSGTVESENDASEISNENIVAVLPANLLGPGNCIFQKQNSLREENPKDIIGTKLYAAPEQLEGHCNPKSDVWSLGIILLELLYPLSTAMERGKVISELRTNGSIPADLEDHLPHMACLIREMVSPNPDLRPSVKEILDVRLPSSGDCRKLMIGNDHDYVNYVDEENAVKSFSFTQSKLTNGCGQTSSKYQYREFHSKSHHTWETVSMGESESIQCGCKSYACHEMREQQEGEITKLKKDNMMKDETIRQLRHQIDELQSMVNLGCGGYPKNSSPQAQGKFPEDAPKRKVYPDNQSFQISKEIYTKPKSC